MKKLGRIKNEKNKLIWFDWGHVIQDGDSKKYTVEEASKKTSANTKNGITIPKAEIIIEVESVKTKFSASVDTLVKLL